MSDQSYLVTARKYRPQVFSDVVSQEHVSETLKNAVKLDRLAHAYLFSGPRGVGKTTAARILAKAINCETPLKERVDGAEPCRSCDSCHSFEEGRNLNIIEIDAASNNRVDDVRDLRETVRIPPQGARMKVYIIDEVHMLSNAAFNALLKTLEEPPPHALFIFATTEPHKVLATIQSRCQRFDFRRIAIPEIISRLTEICTEESIDADEASLMLIARRGDGALRDALSVFDQAVSLCGARLDYQELIGALGVVDSDVFFEVTKAAVEGQSGAMIQIVDRVVGRGYDLQEFLDGLAEHFRNLLVVKTVDDTSLLEVTSQDRVRYQTEADSMTESRLLHCIHLVGETADTLRTTRQPRLRLEMALVRMATLPEAIDMRKALDTLDRLESLALKGGFKASVSSPTTPAQAPPVPTQTPTETEASTLPPLATVKRPTPAPPPTAAVEPPTPALPPPATVKPPTPEPSRPEPIPSPSYPSVVESALPTPDSPVSASSKTVAPGVPLGLAPPALKRSSSQVKATPSNRVSVPETDVLVAPPPDTNDDPDSMMERTSKAWETLVSSVSETRVRLGSLLSQTSVLSASGGIVRIGVPDDFHKRMLRDEQKELSRKLAADAGFAQIDIRLVVSEELLRGTEEEHEAFDARAFLKNKCEENPAVKSLVERFGGEIVW